MANHAANTVYRSREDVERLWDLHGPAVARAA